MIFSPSVIYYLNKKVKGNKNREKHHRHVVYITVIGLASNQMLYSNRAVINQHSYAYQVPVYCPLLARSIHDDTRIFSEKQTTSELSKILLTTNVWFIIAVLWYICQYGSRSLSITTCTVSLQRIGLGFKHRNRFRLIAQKWATRVDKKYQFVFHRIFQLKQLLPWFIAANIPRPDDAYRRQWTVSSWVQLP